MKYTKLNDQAQKHLNLLIERALAGSHDNGWINTRRRERVWYAEDGVTITKTQKLTPEELKYFDIVGD